jgi:hypothetical protein
MSDQQAGVDSSATTQLADAFPLINTCLRVLPPETMNAPAVAPGMSTDEMIRSTVFSPEAFKKQSAQRSDGEPTSLAKTIAASEKATMSLRRDFTENHADYKNKITDFTTLAFSMKRAGNTEAEAAAYYCQGVTRESMGQVSRGLRKITKPRSAGETDEVASAATRTRTRATRANSSFSLARSLARSPPPPLSLSLSLPFSLSLTL